MEENITSFIKFEPRGETKACQIECTITQLASKISDPSTAGEENIIWQNIGMPKSVIPLCSGRGGV